MLFLVSQAGGEARCDSSHSARGPRGGGDEPPKLVTALVQYLSSVALLAALGAKLSATTA
jgi:hypothetical protein